MSQDQIENEIKEYEKSFNSFLSKYELPTEWFLVADHVAIKCADRSDYTNTCQIMSSKTREGVWEIELDGRSLGSAELESPIYIGEHMFSWIEIMQPRPGKESAHGFVEHTEFLFADFDHVVDILNQKNIPYELQENPGHRWINIVIDDQGREIKINNKVLAEVVKWELQEGRLHKRNDL